MKRDIGLDYARVILIMIIVMFHFADAFNLYEYKLFYMKNGAWGWGAVGAFIVLSGYLLRKRYKKLDDLKTFYKKRLLTLYPSFYIAFVIFFIIHTIKVGSPFFGGHPFKIIYSLVGIDAYLGLYNINTYYVVGEWFTGVIIMMYVLYPALNFAMNKSKLLSSLFILGLFSANVILEFDPTPVDASIITGIFLFFGGMLMADYADKFRKNYILGILLLASVIFFIIVPVNIPRAFVTNYMSFALFAALLILFNKAGRNQRANSIIAFFSLVSYEIYLMHHNILYFLNGLLPDAHDKPLMYILYFILVIAAVTAVSYLVHFIAAKLKAIITRN